MTRYELHLIASERDAGNPDSTAKLLGSYDSEDEAIAAGRLYLREHPHAWLQTQDEHQRTPGLDVKL
jgi:hypothetical protein